MSNYTYSIYLVHFPLLFIVTGVFNRGEDGVATHLLWLELVLWAALVAVLAPAIYHSFEKPVSDLRERFTRRVDASPFGPAPPP